MVKFYKTKKVKNTIKKKTKKIYRGGAVNINSDEVNNTLKENKIMEDIKKNSEISSVMPNLNINMENLTKPVSNIIEGTKSVVSNIIEDVKIPVSNIVNKGVTLGEGLVEKGIEKVGDVVGVDVTQPQIIENKLHQIENVISNPEIKKEIGKIVEVTGEAMEPYIKPLEEKVIEKTKEVGKELGTSAVQIGLNTAEEIPGVGVVIGTLRSLDRAAKAGLSTVNAFAEVSKDTTDAINATAKNYKRLMGEKNKIGQRINNSISTFNNPQSLITNQLKPSNIISKKIGGGISNKKKYIKSKKYTRKYK
jgi:rRNA processing protein Gar1